MNKNISPAHLLRLLSVINPIIVQVQDTPRPESVFSGIVFDEKNNRWVVVLKAAYKTKEDAEKFMKLDTMIDNV